MRAKTETYSLPSSKKNIVLIALSFAALLALAGVSAILTFQNQAGENYPGAQELTSNDGFKLLPSFYFQQEKVYITQDYFPTVTRWYANRFGLQPFWHGQSNCIELRTRSVQIVVTKVMNVTVCDTVNGRMIFEERSIQLK